ncbi:MAG: hypothetical protein LCH76_07855 [Actinobacteria bacterium]|nr:hypothetical protein [Actinomycetota bacterium]
MGFWDWLRGGEPEPEPAVVEIATAPTEADIALALARVEELVADPAIPGVVRSRALGVTGTVRKTLPRLGLLGLGSYDSYSVVATATDYLPEAIGAYLRLPRDWADSRPVEAGKTSLMLLIDQLDLLGITMEKIYDAANRTDAEALVSHGRFLQERFGHGPVVPPPVAAPPASSNPLDLGAP